MVFLRAKERLPDNRIRYQGHFTRSDSFLPSYNVDIPFSMKNIHIKKTLLVLALFILLGIPLRFASAAGA